MEGHLHERDRETTASGIPPRGRSSAGAARISHTEVRKIKVGTSVLPTQLEHPDSDGTTRADRQSDLWGPAHPRTRAHPPRGHRTSLRSSLGSPDPQLDGARAQAAEQFAIYGLLPPTEPSSTAKATPARRTPP